MTVLKRRSTTPFLRENCEKFFVDSSSDWRRCRPDDECINKKMLPLPSLLDNEATLDRMVSLSIIVPAKDEALRLPSMLEECINYLEDYSKRCPSFTYEIIIVDDFSVDSTSSVALSYAEKLGNEKMRVLSLTKNRGKGGAVRHGFWAARGRCLLFVDADGATKFDDLEKLRTEMKRLLGNLNDDQLNSMKDDQKSLAVVVGSRAHLERDSIATRSTFRTILMLGFHFLVWLFCVRGVRDTQCGFKLFTRSAAKLLFYNLHVERWAFDVELLFLAEKLKIPVSEVAVTWHEVGGSKLTPLASSVQMAKDLFLIWFRYFFGLWKIKVDVLTL